MHAHKSMYVQTLHISTCTVQLKPVICSKSPSFVSSASVDSVRVTSTSAASLWCVLQLVYVLALPFFAQSLFYKCMHIWTCMYKPCISSPLELCSWHLLARIWCTHQGLQETGIESFRNSWSANIQQNMIQFTSWYTFIVVKSDVMNMNMIKISGWYHPNFISLKWLIAYILRIDCFISKMLSWI